MPEAGSGSRDSGPQSVARVIRMLEALCDSTRPLGLAELARIVGAPKTSLASLLRGLAQQRFVEPGEGGWRLGPGALALGSALVDARRRFPAAELVREGMRRLAEATGETVLFAVRDEGGDMLTYVDVIESRNPVRFAVAPGDRRPLHATAGGRALLSAASDHEVEAHVRGLPTAAAQDELAQAIAAARRSGIAQTVDQAAPGVTGTAVVLRDALGTVLGALIVAAPTERSRDRLDLLAATVRREAATLTRGLGTRAG